MSAPVREPVENSSPLDKHSTPHPGISCTRHQRFDMDCGEFAALIARAAGHCEACGKPEEQNYGEQLVIDHDPKYGWGAVRGLLCHKCNGRLGQLENGGSRGNEEFRRHFEPYIDKAWFVQVASWARTQPQVMGHECGEAPDVVDAVLRHKSIRAITNRLSLQPEIRYHVMPGPGPLRCAAQALWATHVGGFAVLTAHMTYLATGAGPGSPRKAVVDTVSLSREPRQRTDDRQFFARWQDAIEHFKR